MDIIVKDLIEYLKKFPENTKVYLDHDGWLSEDSNNPQEIIANRGLFSHKPEGFKSEYIMINN